MRMFVFSFFTLHQKVRAAHPFDAPL